VQGKLGERPQFHIPGLADMPFVGPALFRQHPMVYIAMALTAGAGLVPVPQPRRPGAARGGRIARVGARAGLPGAPHPLAAVMAGGALCGVAGAYLSVVYTPLWVEGMVAGKGWIALALTTFATWRPARVLLGAYLFGGVTMLQFHLQGQGVEIPSQFLSMLPYLATIVVLVLISRNAAWIRPTCRRRWASPSSPGLRHPGQRHNFRFDLNPPNPGARTHDRHLQAFAVEAGQLVHPGGCGRPGGLRQEGRGPRPRPRRRPPPHRPRRPSPSR
jgi:hypothetical protein